VPHLDTEVASVPRRIAALLEAYEIERRPITDQVSRYAMATSLARTSQRGAIPDTIEQPGPEGDAARARIGQQAHEINVGQFCCGGLNFGYFYVDSPIIAYDGEAAPAYTIYDFSQSTVPGCRTPHLWLRDGRCATDDLFMTRWAPTSHCCGAIRRSRSTASWRRQLTVACR
jgi:hypothetical protein